MTISPVAMGEMLRVVAVAVAIFGFTGTAIAAPEQANPATPAATAPEPPQAPTPQQIRTVNIDAYDIDGNTLLPQTDVEEAVYPYLGPARTRQDIEAARKALERAFQDRGYQTVVVELPPQNVTAGIVRMKVIEAPIGKLTVTGSRYYSEDTIREQVPALQEGKVPNFQKAQQEIADLNRLPDRRVAPALKAGKTPGTVDVDLKVSDHLPLHASLEVNNDHGPSTTPLRTSLSVHYDNLWQLGHSLTATVLVAPQRLDDAKVFAGSYLAPVWGSPWNILLYGYTSNSDVTTIGSLSVLGKGYAIGLRGIRQLSQWGDFSQSINFGIDFKHFLEDLSAGPATVSAPIEYWPLSASYSVQAGSGTSILNVTLSATGGLRGLGGTAFAFFNKRGFASPDFVHINLDADYLADLGSDVYGDFRLAGQVSDGPLISNEQFSAGGFTSVRGYLQSEAIGDDGIFASAEFRTPSIATWLFDFVDEWRFYTFADGANLWVSKALPGQQSSFTLYSIGAGTRFSLFKHFTADTFVGLPLRSGSVSKADHPYAEFKVRTEF